MLKVRTKLPNYYIGVTLVNLLRLLFSSKRVSRPVIIESHISSLETIRKVGFQDEAKFYEKIRFMPDESKKICSSTKKQIFENQNTIMQLIGLSTKAKKSLMAILVVVSLIIITLTVLKELSLVLICFALALTCFVMFAHTYLRTLETIARCYYTDGQLRQILMKADSDRRFQTSYDLSIPLV